MTAQAAEPVYDDTPGGAGHSGRRGRIIQILRDAEEPLAVETVAALAGIHINTARFHLESLVGAGLAKRETEIRRQPGRRRVLYSGTLPSQTTADGYSLLATMLAAAVAARFPEPGDDMYQVGQEWGRYLTSQPAPFEVFDEDEIGQRVLDKLDAAWFAQELRPAPAPQLLMHNCPFAEAAQQAPDIVCQLHAGLINGALEELRSGQRVVKLEPQTQPHPCRAWLAPTPEEPLQQVPLIQPQP